MSFYEDYNSDLFEETLNKYEFISNNINQKKEHVYQEPQQLLLKNYISQSTIYDSLLLFHDLGVGKCHAIDTPIIMFDGSIKKVQDIKVGDLLMGDDSTPRTVLSLARGEDNMYDIIPTKGEKYTVNEEHILCLKASGFPKVNENTNIHNKNFNVQWIENNKFQSKTFTYNKNNKKQKQQEALEFYNNIKNEQILEISVKDYLKLSNSRKSILKGYRTGIDFQPKNVPIDPYMIGYWLGDGTARDSAITCQDSAVLHYFVNNLGKYDLSLIHRKNSYTYGISGFNGKYHSNLFLSTMKNLNLQNNKHIPNIYKYNSRENRLKLLAGIIDSDGHYSRGMFEISQSIKHEKLIDDIIYLARSLGFACYKNIKKTTWTHNGIKQFGEAYRITISGKGLDQIPTLIPRKKASPRSQIKDVLVTGIKIEYVGRNNYYGFTLDKNCRYIMGDFTVTHNTCTSITISEGFKEYINNMGRKVVVLVKNKNIQRNFMNELVSKCTNDTYVNEKERELYFGININKTPQVQSVRKELINKVHRHINKNYSFLTYGTFVNRVLGIKEFEKDEMGRNTSKVKKIDGKIKRKTMKNPIVNFNNTVIIVDEAHNITNNDVYVALHQVLSRSYNFRIVLLTATPMYDNPKEIIEISNLLNINNGNYQLPIRNDLFKPIAYGEFKGKTILTKYNSKYINNRILKGGIIKITPDGENILKKTLLGKISYLKANEETFPKKIQNGIDLIKNRIGSLKVVYCQMSKYQYDIYLDALKNDLRMYSKFDISTAIQNLESAENTFEKVTISKSSSLYKNSSDASTMVYPNEEYGKVGFLNMFEKSKRSDDYSVNDKSILTSELRKYSAKLYVLLQNIQKSKGNVFIYSNYVSYGGTSLIKQLLLNNGYTEYLSSKKGEYNTFVIFDESTNMELREKYRRIYNSEENKEGKLIKIIVGSPIISEGITLKNVRQVHILEPAWNMSRINQIIGRAVRNFSHNDLDLEDRNVEIFKYVSVYYPKEESKKIDIKEEDIDIKYISKFFIDREKYILSEEKDRSNKIIERILKEISFDCDIMKNRNLRDSSFDNMSECDYQSCEFKCQLKPKGEIDKSTYDLYIQNFDKYDIDHIINKIKQMFKEYFVWHLDDIMNNIKTEKSYISDEAIYVSLNHLVENKTSLFDMYEREGFLINKGLYYMFNPNEIEINTSIYSKILNFEVFKNKYNLKEFVEKKVNKNIFKESIKEKKEKKKEVEEVKLSEADIKFNMKILNNKDIKIFGTYRQRGTKDNLFGPKDDKFRIVDTRDLELKEDDKRKTVSGMWIGSYKKPKLIDIVKYLNIELKNIDKLSLEEYDKDKLADIIKDHLIKNKLVLK